MRVSQALCRWIKAHVGLLITEKNIDSVALACQSLANELAMSVADLEQVVLSSSPDLVRLQAPAELTQASLLDLFIDRITTHEAYFLRHEENMRLVARSFAHDCINKRGCFRVLSLPCAAGEEPYSIAISLVEALGKFDTNIEIIASDIDSNVLETAALGVYHESRIQTLSTSMKKRFFHRGTGSNAGFVRVVPELRKMVKFKQINLLDSKWPVELPVNVIFCRNVMIYFNREMQEALLTRMVSLLPKDGLYIAGHSENFSYFSHVVTPVGKTTYRPA